MSVENLNNLKRRINQRKAFLTAWEDRVIRLRREKTEAIEALQAEIDAEVNSDA